jgi:hypothetical protein
VYFNHHYTRTPEEAVRDVLRAGTDIDCGGFVSTYAPSALAQGLITQADIDARLRRSLRVRFRLSHFDPLGPLDRIPPSAICSAASLATAREGARQGAVLVKNDAGALPIPLSGGGVAAPAAAGVGAASTGAGTGAGAATAGRGAEAAASFAGSVAVIGPNIHLSRSVAGYYGGNSCNGTYHDMVDAVKLYCADVRFTKGVDSPQANASTAGVTAAVAMGASVDRVILVVGTDLTWAREGHDAESLSFSAGTLALVDAVAAAAKRPVVVVVMTATPLDLSPLLSNQKVGAVLHVGMPSVATLGVGDVLFGTASSPAGRTILTVFPADYVQARDQHSH